MAATVCVARPGLVEIDYELLRESVEQKPLPAYTIWEARVDFFEDLKAPRTARNYFDVRSN